MPANSAPTLTPLPPIPRFDAWAPAVQSAELLRGTLVRCGPGRRLVGWPETPRVRALALSPWLTDQRIAVRMTAAWVWGAAAHPGVPLRFAMSDGRRAPRSPSPEYTLQQFQFEPNDIMMLDAFAVTSQFRTLFDLLRASSNFDRDHRVACRLLLARLPDGRAQMQDRLANGGRPYRALALARLTSCGGPESASW